VARKRSFLKGGKQEEEVKGTVDNEGKPCSTQSFPETEKPSLFFVVGVFCGVR